MGLEAKGYKYELESLYDLELHKTHIDHIPFPVDADTEGLEQVDRSDGGGQLQGKSDIAVDEAGKG